MAERANSPILQAGVVPYRTDPSGVQFCLITSIRKGNWGFPKGIIDPGETAQQTALKEAAEEAGLHGNIEGEPLGEYEYAKWGTTLVVSVYLMRVTAVDDEWEEASVRQRKWCDTDTARDRIRREELLSLLEAAVGRIESDGG
jgi:8-oxo-dGTP pyrophosphatase MutT (NUDIX family)